MFRCLIFIISLTLICSSCSNDLGQKVSLQIDTTDFVYRIISPADAEYYFESDSSSGRTEIISSIRRSFLHPGHDISISGQNPQFIFRIISCKLTESETQQSILDPADSVFPYDSLHFVLHSIEAQLSAVISNSQGFSIPISEYSSDEDELRTGPSAWQSVFGHKEYYPPSVNRIDFPDKQLNRVIRRAHDEAIVQMKAWLGH